MSIHSSGNTRCGHRVLTSFSPSEFSHRPAGGYELSVSDVMTDGYASVTEEISIADVLDQSGAFTPADDLLHLCRRQRWTLSDVVSVRELLSTQNGDLVVSFREDTDAEQAALQVTYLRYPAVPLVADDSQLVGIVRTDIEEMLSSRKAANSSQNKF